MKMRWGILLAVFFFALLLAGAPALAHHGVPGFDMSRNITIKGVVVDYMLINPHMELMVKVTDEHGESVNWNVEGVSLLMMVRAGYKKDTLKAGDVITVTGHPNKDGKPQMYLLKIVLPDGRELQNGYDGLR